MKHLYLIIGPSGSGKTTLVNRLQKKHGLVPVESYTTRPIRRPDETGHIFVTDEVFDCLGEFVAYTEYNGYRYGVTADILNESDLYVIDPAGAAYLDEHYKEKPILKIWLKTPVYSCTNRMRNRGDNDSAILDRVTYDQEAFGPAAYFATMQGNPNNMTINTGHIGSAEVERRVWNYICEMERDSE